MYIRNVACIFIYSLIKPHLLRLLNRHNLLGNDGQYFDVYPIKFIKTRPCTCAARINIKNMKNYYGKYKEQITRNN